MTKQRKSQLVLRAAVLLVLLLASLAGFVLQNPQLLQATPRAVVVSQDAPPAYDFASPLPLSQLKADKVCAASLFSEHELEAQNSSARREQVQALALEYPQALLATLVWIEQHDGLPNCYLNKQQAYDKGWRGGPLWGKLGEGTAIGGSRFENREGLLPARYNGRYYSADLDYDGDERGARRLVYVIDAQGEEDYFWVTTDHYASFFALQNAQTMPQD